MAWPKFTKKELLIAAGLFFFFLLSRFVNLTIIPIFTDEAIYLRWAQIAKNDAAWRFISLTDGKQPLYVWLTMVAMKLISDPLIAGRVVSVISGLISLISIWLLTYILFENKKASFFASSLYLFSPFALVYDRMALMDSLVGTFSLLSLFLAVLLVKTLRLDVALILGFSLGGGMLTKTSGFLNLYLLLFSLLLFDWQKQKRWERIGKWLGLALLAAILSQGFYSILRLSPLFHMVAQKDTTFIYPFTEWLQHPWQFFWGNLKGEFDWLFRYLTPIWLALALLAFLFKKEEFFSKTLLFLWCAAPFTALALFGKVLYPRFIFFMALSLLVLVAYSLEKISRKIKNKFLVFGFWSLVFVYPLYIDYQILFNPDGAPIPQSDKGQYITSWPSGIGIKEATQFFTQEAEKQPLMIATEGTFGMFPACFELYLWDHPNVEIKGYWPVNEIPQEVAEKAKQKLTFFTFNETQDLPHSWPLELVKEYPKIEKPYSLRVYRVLPVDAQE